MKTLEKWKLRSTLIIPPNIEKIGVNKLFYLRTYGCQSNVRDSETICGIMQKLYYSKTENIEKADFIILNTCAIRDNAEQKVFGEIGLIQKYRAEKPELIIAVCGCMMQEPHVVSKLKNSKWNVDIIFGTNNIHQLPSLIETYMFSSYTNVTDVYHNRNIIVENLPVQRQSKIKAFVHVMFGCSNFCTFCIVPYTRGKERSRELYTIIAEINNLIKEGYQEITLLGQNVNNYGLDLQPRLTFKTLLKSVAKTKIKRIRFITSNPWNFDQGIIDIVKNHPNIMPYFHLPIQSGNDSVLAQMNRSMIIPEYKAILDEIRHKIPNASISTDIIVGFPNESDAQFNDTISLYKYAKYDNAYTFIYSPRKNTLAAEWNDTIALSVKKARLQKLNILVKKYSKWRNEQLIGKTLHVLVEGFSKKNKKRYFGYSESWKLVNFDYSKSESITGQIVPILITGASNFNLSGVWIENDES